LDFMLSTCAVTAVNLDFMLSTCAVTAVNLSQFKLWRHNQ